MAYAEKTTVSVEKSRLEIERTMERFGATGIAFMRDDETRQVAIGFRKDNRHYRFVLPLPDPESDRWRWPHPDKSHYGQRERSDAQATAAIEQEKRRLFRSLANYIKAVLDAIESGITTTDQALLPYMVLPSGQTVAETARVQLADTGTINFTMALPEGR